MRHGALLALHYCTAPRLQGDLLLRLCVCVGGWDGWTPHNQRNNPNIIAVALADRCIRVLALERVNDYANERVSSPVREAAAALLSSVMGALTDAQFAQGKDTHTHIHRYHHHHHHHLAFIAMTYCFA